MAWIAEPERFHSAGAKSLPCDCLRCPKNERSTVYFCFWLADLLKTAPRMLRRFYEALKRDFFIPESPWACTTAFSFLTNMSKKLTLVLWQGRRSAPHAEDVSFTYSSTSSPSRHWTLSSMLKPAMDRVWLPAQLDQRGQ